MTAGSESISATEDFVHGVRPEEDAARCILEALRSSKTCGLRSFIDERFSSAVAGIPTSLVNSNEVAFRHTWAVANYYHVPEVRQDASCVPGLLPSDIVGDDKRDVAERVYKKVRLAHLADISSAIGSAFASDMSSLLAFCEVGEVARAFRICRLQDIMIASWRGSLAVCTVAMKKLELRARAPVSSRLFQRCLQCSFRRKKIAQRLGNCSAGFVRKMRPLL